MRMLAHSQDISFWVDFLRSMHQQGIRVLHTSVEYDSFPLLCEVLRRLRKDGIAFRHMVKLAEPSFDEPDFSTDRLLTKLHVYQQLLGTECIENVQWMWRSNLKNLIRRMDRFSQALSAIDTCLLELKSAGHINKVVCFPYTPDFANIAIRLPNLDGLAVYWNPDEQDYLSQMTAYVQNGKQVYTLRPFSAGKFKQATCEQLLDFTFDTDLVTGTILTASQTPHIKHVLTYLHKKRLDLNTPKI